MIGKKGLAMVLLLCFTIVTSNSVAQTCNNNVEIPASTPTARFTDNGNGTVTHHKTGLMWAKCVEGLSSMDCTTGTAATYTWQEALEVAQASTLAGKGDWRLPNIKELQSIIEEQCVDPAINLTVFPQTPLSPCWSSSADSQYVGFTWVVLFDDGFLNRLDRSSSRVVRLVHSGQ